MLYEIFDEDSTKKKKNWIVEHKKNSYTGLWMEFGYSILVRLDFKMKLTDISAMLKNL